jgi:hypothetical protein
MPAGKAERSDRFFEILGSAERDLLAGLDLDGLARRRVAPHAGGAMPDLQDAQPHQAQAVALLEVFGHETHQVGEQGFGLLLRNFVTLRQLRCQIPQGDGRLSLRGFFAAILNELLFERSDDLHGRDCSARSTLLWHDLAFIRDSLGRDHGKAQFSGGFRSEWHSPRSNGRPSSPQESSSGFNFLPGNH